MPDRAEFQEKQYAFARHIRDPKNNPAPIDTEDRRMAIYRELFFNNLLNLLGQTFPVLEKLLTKDKWRSLIRQFMVNHEAQSPYFLEVPQEFVKFLETGYTLEDDDFPFLIELAHYEWVELALSVSDDKNDLTGIDQSGDLLAGIPVASRLAWAFSYQFAVHRNKREIFAARTRRAANLSGNLSQLERRHGFHGAKSGDRQVIRIDRGQYVRERPRPSDNPRRGNSASRSRNTHSARLGCHATNAFGRNSSWREITLANSRSQLRRLTIKAKRSTDDGPT